jgi:hypothetical protein
MTLIEKSHQKAGYLLLTAAMYHANDFDTTQLLMRLRSSIASDMPLESLLESTVLCELLVWPRFS